MKPKLIDRFILWILLILLVAIAVLLIGVALNLIPMNSIEYLLEIIYAYQINAVIVGCIGLVVLVLALRLMFAGKGKPKIAPAPSSALVHAGEIGSSYITLSALDSMVQKHVRGNNRIKDCESQVSAVSEGVVVKLKLALMPDTNIPELTKALQSSLKAYVESLSGIQVTEVAILITAASGTPKSRVD